MDEMRAILDSLMGKDRDSSLSERKNKRPMSWRDPEVCKHYLLDFCPHDLFPNTKRDLGACKGIHSDGLKQKFQDDPERDKYAEKYESDFINFLEELVEQVEQKIRKGNERIVAPLPSETAGAKVGGSGGAGGEGGADDLSEEKQTKIDALNTRISTLMKEAQEAGERGDIKEAETLTTQINGVRKEMDRIRREGVATPFDAFVHKEKQLRVCAICGAMQSLGDSMSRFESHIAGKQHQGFERIRSTLEALKAKREEKTSKREEKTSKQISKSSEGECTADVGEVNDSRGGYELSAKESSAAGRSSGEEEKRTEGRGRQSSARGESAPRAGGERSEVGGRLSRSRTPVKRSPSGSRTRQRNNEADAHGDSGRSDWERRRNGRHRDDRYRDDRYRDDRYRDDRYRDDRYRDDRYRSDRHRSDRYRDDRYRDDARD